MITLAMGALAAGFVLFVVRAIRSRSEADVRLAAGSAVALLLAGTVFLATYAVILENYQVGPTGAPFALAAAGACLLGAAFGAGCLYTGRRAWWRPRGHTGLGLRAPAPRDGEREGSPVVRTVSRAEALSFLGFVAFAALFAGAFGFVHDQISYSVSPEYFTRFKFDQFHLQAPAIPERLRAGMVGFLASWRMGIALGVLCGAAGFMQRTPAQMRRALLLTLPVVASITLTFALAGLAYGCFQTRDFDPSGHRGWHLPSDVADGRAFLCAGYMHAAAYLGALLAVPCAWAFHARFRKARTHRDMTPGPDLRRGGPHP